MNSNEVVLRFCIWGFDDITHDEISKALGVNPTKVYIKGQRKHANFSALAKENGWLFEPDYDRYASFQDKLAFLLQFLTPRTEVIKEYCKKYKCEISCGVYIYFENGESTPSIYLNTEYNRIIKELDIAFDVDIICLPN